jgi:hypothetical protein
MKWDYITTCSCKEDCIGSRRVLRSSGVDEVE